MRVQYGSVTNLSLVFIFFLKQQLLAECRMEYYGSLLGPISDEEPNFAEAEGYDVRSTGRNDEAIEASGGEVFVLEDKDYPKSLFEHHQGVGQVSGIATLPTDNVVLFHRADRRWMADTFGPDHKVANLSQAQEALIARDTIMIVDGNDGSALTTLGSNLFYLPHSIASDEQGNLWVSDVGRHQVMRLPTGVREWTRLQGKQASPLLPDGEGNLNLNNGSSQIWPDIILGEAFIPGKDQYHFCKPAEVVVSSDGRLVFVADGYCNQRVVVFTGSGQYLTSFGEEHQMEVVHSLTLFPERNLLCVSDRENSRILCFLAGLDGDLSRLGQLELMLDYPLGRVFAMEAISPDHLLVASSSGTNWTSGESLGRFDLAAVNPFTKEIKQVWSSSDLLAPHSLAATRSRELVYAADLSPEAFKKLFKFNVLLRK